MSHSISNTAVDDQQRAWRAAAAVPDPELPCITVGDLGVLRRVDIIDGKAVATVTPTYTGCPAVHLIEQLITTALENAGFSARVVRVFSPAWTSDWITAEGRENLRAFGIAPPHKTQTNTITFFKTHSVTCPRCGSLQTRRLSEFGSTACKAHYRCNNCTEPFDFFKPI